jgi:hypothetical protein
MRTTGNLDSQLLSHIQGLENELRKAVDEEANLKETLREKCQELQARRGRVVAGF